jgi:aryl-alcohol dehydrogenase-like predicted oxidoreductase
MHDAVSTAIPGAKNPDQAMANAAASDLSMLSDETMASVADVYERSIKQEVHARW